MDHLPPGLRPSTEREYLYVAIEAGEDFAAFVRAALGPVGREDLPNGGVLDSYARIRLDAETTLEAISYNQDLDAWRSLLVGHCLRTNRLCGLVRKGLLTLTDGRSTPLLDCELEYGDRREQSLPKTIKARGHEPLWSLWSVAARLYGKAFTYVVSIYQSLGRIVIASEYRIDGGQGVPRRPVQVVDAPFSAEAVGIAVTLALQLRPETPQPGEELILSSFDEEDRGVLATGLKASLLVPIGDFVEVIPLSRHADREGFKEVGSFTRLRNDQSLESLGEAVLTALEGSSTEVGP